MTDQFGSSLRVLQLKTIVNHKLWFITVRLSFKTYIYNSQKTGDQVAWVDDARVKLTWHQQSASIRCLLSNTLKSDSLKRLNIIAKKRYKTRGEKPPSDGEDDTEDMDTNDITCPLTGIRGFTT